MRAGAGVVSLALAFALLEVLVLCARVPYLVPARFEQGAPVIAVRGPFRLGYVCLQHGCVPVWTCDLAGVTSADPRRAPTARDWDPALRRLLIGEIRDLPRHVLIDAAIVAALGAWWTMGVSVVRRRAGGQDAAGAMVLRHAALAGAAAGAVTWAIIVAPMVVFGYGVPPHTNQIGPGALSTTTGGPPLLIGPGALAYRFVLAAASLLPMIVVAPLECVGVVIPPGYFTSIAVVVGFVTHGAGWAVWFAMSLGGGSGAPHGSTRGPGASPGDEALSFFCARSLRRLINSASTVRPTSGDTRSR